MYQMRNIRIGTISRISVDIVGYVRHRILPIPTEAAIAISTRTPAERAPVRLASTQAAHAANRKDMLDTAFSGSASNPSPTRSQWTSIMSALHIPLSTYAHNDRVVGVLLHRDDARLLTLAGGRRGVLQRALSPRVVSL